jgi:UDP-N-acetylmuramoylalanine--D-glutamate ligase
MIPVTSFAGKTVAVFGLGGSGLASCHALKAGGAEVIAADDNADNVAKAAQAGFITADLRSVSWQNFAALILTPGAPLTHPTPHWSVLMARQAGAEVIGDVELFCRERRRHAPDAPFVAITGTNGKSTTTALIGHILGQAGRRVEIGGNLGTPALSLAPLGADGIYVLETSSFQLDLIETLAFDVAVLLNVTPDHLDRHGDMDGYIAAKKRIFARQGTGAAAIVGIDDAICRDIVQELRRDGAARVIPISVTGTASEGIYVEGGWLIDATGEGRERVLDLAGAERLPGSHNAQNAAAAYAASRALGVEREEAAAAIRSFPGLAHRQELVGTIGGVRYINDSKATNADATEKALACYDAIYWILGGLPKAGGIASLTSYFPRVRHAYLIGAATEEFAATLGDAVPFSRCGDLESALAAAHETAQHDKKPGAVVLLSPACASYDQFPNFEVRGDTFRELVAGLAGERAR